MSRCIAIANQKGGVGKTTTCVNLTAALASIGKRVLLIDLDPQGNATMGCGIDKYDLDRSVFEVLVDGMSVAEARVRSDSNNCDVLPATADLTAAEIELMAMDQRERRLATALEAVSAEYDYMLIDCPPSLSILTLNAFVAANGILVPVQCEYYALEGLSALLDTIESVREKQPGYRSFSAADRAFRRSGSQGYRATQYQIGRSPQPWSVNHPLRSQFPRRQGLL